ncbi:hypothetical protein [Erythrobacter sp.]|jgi:hypothetical protein|uniref:hypothetical protein n=1 Tax=Erythrobacter sp. TaxID=1042 RepID=UPI002E9AA9F6|nr:hypothetical protein [Erythrobacter sp.]
MPMPKYMRAYTIRIVAFITAYMIVLFAGLTYARASDPAPIALVILALATALPIVGMFFRLLVECDDEYQRQLFVKQVLLATGAMLAIVTVWQFLEVYDVVPAGPQWIGVLWLAMLGLAAPIVRWRA